MPKAFQGEVHVGRTKRWAGGCVAGMIIAPVVLAQPVENQVLEQVGGGGADPTLEETLVLGERRGSFTEITQETQKLVDMPGAMGDPLAAVFSLPGVVYSNGGGGEPAVRGSSPSDNQFLIDFMPAGYIFHDFNTSVFHEYIMQDFQLHSAGFGPQYSDVTGAVFDITLRQPKNERLSGVFDLSMLRSGIFVEGGITENTAFYVSGRQSLIHLFIDADDMEEEDGFRVEKMPRDTDYQAKFLWTPSADNSITFSASGATDAAAATATRDADFVRSNPDFAGYAEIDNGYDGQNIIWDNYSTGGHLKVGVGHLTNKDSLVWGDGYFYTGESVTDTLKAQYAVSAGSNHTLTVGAKGQQNKLSYSYDQVLFVCTDFDADCTLTRRDRVADKQTIEPMETMVFVNDRWQLASGLFVDLGLQWQNNDYTDESFTNPRIAMEYRVAENWTLTSSAGRYNRFPDLETILPRVGNPELRSPTSDHFTLGVMNDLSNGWSWTLESYYKTMDDLPLALSEDDPDGDLLYVNDVEGRAYGFDLLINKELTGKWYSWMALSYAKSERTNVRTDHTVDYYLDTPVVFNWVVNYSPTKIFNLGWRWTARSGTAYTPIVGLRENPWFEDSVLPEYGEAYSERLPLFSQLDLRFKWYSKLWRLDAEYMIDVINAFNQKNVVGRALDYEKIDSVNDDVAIEETETFGIIFAAGLRIKI